MIPIIKERIIKALQGDQDIDTGKLNLDVEREHMLLMNLFTSGNYAHPGATNWHDTERKTLSDDIEDVVVYSDDRKELTDMNGKLRKNYIQGGFDTAGDDKEGRHKLDFEAEKPQKDGTIVVNMVEKNTSVHTFVITKEAIAGFYYDRPIRGRYALVTPFGEMEKAKNAFCCKSYGVQLIAKDGTKETITAVHKEGPGQWQFEATTDNAFGDAINFAFGDEMRFCAFAEAFRAALVDGSRGGAYEWLYKEICYGRAS